MTSINSVPRLNREVAVQRVGGRLLAMGPDDCLHSFEDEAGAPLEAAERIVELVDGRRSVAELARAICDEFDVKAEVSQADALQFIDVLIEKKVLVLEK